MTSFEPSPNLPSDSNLDLDFIDRAMTFTPSEQCTISCGTVCIDPRASKVLIIFNRRLGIWQLPKGRKNIGEDLQSAALRETYEETGVHADLAPLKIRTRSTPPIAVRDLVEDAPRRGYDVAFHRATPSTTSASSASTAGSMSVVSMSSSVTAPSYTPTSTSSNGLVGSPMHDEYRAPMADGRRGGSRSGFEALENVPHPINILGVPASPVMDKITSAATVGAEVQATSLAMPAMPAMPATPETPATITDAKLTSHVFNNELIGIVQYPDLQVATPQTIKTVFFFAAFADSTAAMGAGAQEDHEDLQAEWVDFKIAGDRLRFSSEKEAVYKARQDMKRSGLEC